MPPTARQPAKHPVLRELGARVRQLREARGWSQEALADTVGFGRSYLSGLERGIRNPSAVQLVRLAKALRVPVGDLFGR